MQCNYMPTGSCSTKKLCTEVFLQGRYRPSAQSFPENAGPYGSGFTGTSVGSASHAIHPVLAEAEGSICGLASRNGDSGLCISPGLLKGPPLAKARRDLTHGAQKEGCHDRRFQQGLGSAVRGQTNLRSLVWRGVGPARQLPRNASSIGYCRNLGSLRNGTSTAFLAVLWAALLSSFRRRNLRCGSKAAAYIARRPTYFGGQVRERLEQKDTWWHFIHLRKHLSLCPFVFPMDTHTHTHTHTHLNEH